MIGFVLGVKYIFLIFIGFIEGCESMDVFLVIMFMFEWFFFIIGEVVVDDMLKKMI